MPSPFPGMDPYLESHWRDVHHSLITYARDAIQDSLPQDLRARVEERVLLETPEGLGNPMFPDLRVIESRPQRSSGAIAVVRSDATAPIIVDAEREPLTEGYIEILDASSGNRIVTIIEILSPTNKTPGDGMQEYKLKQREIIQSETNLVEIDLVRTGKHVLAVPRDNISSKFHARYMVCVRRPALRSKAEIYPIPLSTKLPTVNIPLRRSDEDVPLDLQALIELCYRKGRYDGDIDYSRDPEPPFTGPDATWAAALLRDKGLRPAEPPKRKRKRNRNPPRASDSA